MAHSVHVTQNRKLRNLLCQFVSGKEKAKLETGRVLGIGTVNGIVFDVASPLLANGAFLGMGRIGGAHQLAQVGDSVFLFQSQSYDRAARHEGSERVVKRLASMHRVKLFG